MAQSPGGVLEGLGPAMSSPVSQTGIEGTLSKFGGGTRPSRALHVPQGWDASHRDLDKPKKWVLMRSSKARRREIQEQPLPGPWLWGWGKEDGGGAEQALSSTPGW